MKTWHVYLPLNFFVMTSWIRISSDFCVIMTTWKNSTLFVKWAKENDVTLITDEHVQIINDKRRQEKEGR